MNPEKKAVYNFYSSVGWNKNPDGGYVDGDAEDRRQVSREYINRCHERLGRQFDPSGDLFLDCASGPVQFPQYLAYSRHYRKRVCVDFSLQALVEARANHGDHLLCVVADITRLPFRDDTFDCVASLHTVYHVPAAEQSQAFSELYRTTRPGKKCVTVYSVGDSSLLNRILLIPCRAFNLLTGRSDRVRRLIGRLKPKPAEQGQAEPETAPGGFYPHNWAWLEANVLAQGDQPVVVTWRSLSVPVLRYLIHPWAFGKQLLGLVYRMENLFPRLAARTGQYPVIVRTKR